MHAGFLALSQRCGAIARRRGLLHLRGHVERCDLCALESGPQRLRARRDDSAFLRSIHEQRDLIFAQIAACQLAHVVRARREHALEVSLAQLPIPERFPFGEMVRLSLHVFEPADPA